MSLDPREDRPVVENQIVTVKYGRTTRNIHLRVGAKYIVEPMNRLKKKHRGRLCEFVGFDGFVGDALVRFLDTGRVGKVGCGDLVERP